MTNPHQEPENLEEGAWTSTQQNMLSRSVEGRKRASLPWSRRRHSTWKWVLNLSANLKKSHLQSAKLFLSTQLSGWKWGWIWDGALRKMSPSNTQVPQIFIHIVHSHPPVFRTKACPEFGTLSCPRCLEWGHWEDSCWAIDHVCERWLLWEIQYK